MNGWYSSYIRFLTKVAAHRYPGVGWLWMLLIASSSWTSYWLFAEHRLGGELLLPLLCSLWLLVLLFIRLVFAYQRPWRPAGAGWRMKLKLYWFYFKYHGMACFILALLMGSLLLTAKLASIVWRSFG
jgi:hypothetical protein